MEELKKLGLMLAFTFAGQALTWYQMFGSQKFSFLYSKYAIYILAIPIGFFMITAAKLGTEYFNGVNFPMRIISFSIGNLVFFLFSYYFLNESINMKGMVCLSLSILIILIQLFWK